VADPRQPIEVSRDQVAGQVGPTDHAADEWLVAAQREETG
jgi:hypothetical protein